MKVFFTTSPKGKADFGADYQLIYETIADLGHVNLTDFIIKVKPEEHYRLRDEELVRHYQNTIRLVKEADVVIVEASAPSMAMGYIVDRTIDCLKPLIVLYTAGKEPFFIAGIKDDRIQIIEYTRRNLAKVLKAAFVYAQEQMDTRFNFFISPKISNYLDWIARKKKTPRAVYLRRLIEKDMERNKEYKKS
jgi:hypothetical protein